MHQRTPRSRLLTVATTLATLLAGTSLVACGGSSDDGESDNELLDALDRTGGLGGDLDDSDGVGDAMNAGVGDTDAPVVVTIDGVSFGYRHGSCRVDDEAVRFEVVTDERMALGNSVQITWHPRLDHRPWSRQETSLLVSHASNTAPAPFVLLGGSTAGWPDSTWEVSVSGTTVEILATLGTDPRLSGDERHEEVRIVARCDTERLGDGPPFGGPTVRESGGDPDIDTLLSYAVEGQVEVTFQGVTHSIDYLTTCNFHDAETIAEGLNDDLQIYFHSGVQNTMRVQVGDGRLHSERRVFQPADGVQFEFTGTSTRTWSGTVVDDAGNEEPITVTVTCAG